MTSVFSCLVATLALGADPGLQGLPFGVPPAADDAVIASVAPPQCLFYVNWAGTASPNPASKCETEKMLAEPEVQEFIGGLSKVFVAYLRHTDEEAKKGADMAASATVAPVIASGPATAPNPYGSGSATPAYSPCAGPTAGTANAAPIPAPAPVPAAAATKPAEQKPAFGISTVDYGDLLSVIFTHPTAIYAGDVKYAAHEPKAAADKKKKNANSEAKPQDDDAPEYQGGMVVDLGPDFGRLHAKFSEYLAKAKKAGVDTTIEQITIGGETWYRTKPTHPGDKNLATFGFHGKYFVFAVGQGEAEGIIARWNRPAPAWLAKAMQQTVVPRRTGIIYVNLKLVREKLLPLADSKKDALALLDTLGLDNVDSFVSTTGLEEQGMVNRVLLAIDGKPRGLLDMVSDRPLDAKDLEPIPRDALLAFAARIDLDRTTNAVIAAQKKSGQASAADCEKSIEEFKKQSGIDLHRVWRSLGDTWCIYNSPVEGEFPLCGWTAVVPVRDRALLLHYFDVCVARATDATKKDGKEAKENDLSVSLDAWGDVRKCHFAGHEIYYCAGQPIAPAVCVTDRELVMTLNMPAMKAYLIRKEHRSLATLASVQSALNGPDRPMALGYCDTPRLFDLLYPVFSLYASLGSAAVQKTGVELDPTFSPSAPALRPHLSPDITTLKRTPHGLELTCHYCLPTGGVNGPLWIVGLYSGATVIAMTDFWRPRFEPSHPPASSGPPAQPPAATCPKPAQSSAPACPPAPGVTEGNAPTWGGGDAPAWDPYATKTAAATGLQKK